MAIKEAFSIPVGVAEGEAGRWQEEASCGKREIETLIDYYKREVAGLIESGGQGRGVS